MGSTIIMNGLCLISGIGGIIGSCGCIGRSEGMHGALEIPTVETLDLWLPVIGVWSATTKFALADHTRSGQFFLPAIARSADLRGRRSVLGGARMHVSQIH